MKKFILLVIGILFTVGGVMLWPGHGEPQVEFYVKEGASAQTVARLLQGKGVLTSTFPLRFWMRIARGDLKIHVGRYRIPPGRSAFWIARDLIQGRTIKSKINIPEGFTSHQIAERLETAEMGDAEEFKQYVMNKKLEGFLYPATYELDYGLSAERMARHFTAKFDSVWTADYSDRAKALGMTKKEIVTLASIIEREARVRDELPQIASVYHNRLKKRMRLEADPTVQYALGQWKARLLNKDYRNTKSPYNTYLVYGLPPGPICNPGEDAIKASLWPAETDYLYFVAQDDGRHNFSPTYKDHINKVKARDRRKKS